MKKQLIEKINKREAVIGIVGLGYVGLPLMLRYVEEKFKVVGFDIDEAKITKLNAGKSYIEHITDDSIDFAVKHGFRATTDFTKIKDVDAIILCVPTPLNKYREPDLSYVINTTDSIAPYIRPGHIVSLESTTYPGTTDEELVPRLSNEINKLGHDVFIVYSPEREDPGRQDYNTKTTPKVCGGVTEACLEVGVALYSVIVDRVVPVSSTRAAEMTKLLENIHRAVNIGLVNEMKMVADKMDIDIHEVIDAAATKPFGFVAYRPGPGLGGHCIPIDPFYLTWKAREYDIHTRFIELAGEVNNSMSSYVMKKIGLGMNERRVTINGSKILVLGIAYKKNIDDVRESPSVRLMEKLRRRGADVSYSDPHVPVFPKMREHKFDLASVAITPENLAKYDCVVLATDHDKFDYPMIIKHAKFIVDTRGKFKEKTDSIMRA